ncbi:MAG: substrate-binding domain-containing protein [Lachnospiraceae bacterium]
MKKNENKYLFLAVVGIIVIAVVILFLYLNSEDAGSTGTEQQVKIVCIPKAMDDSNDFWTAMIEGAQMAALDNDVDLTIMSPRLETDIDVQNQMIEDAIAMQPNAIVLAPCDYIKTTPYAQKVVDAGIKLLILDSTMDKDFGCTVVATDNVEAGRKMGEYMKGHLNEDSVIGIVGHVKGASTATDREKGIREAIGEFEDQIVDVVFCNSSYSTAIEVTEQMLAEHPDINVIFGLNEYSAVGAARAIKKLGLTGKVHMIGFDSSLEEVSMMEEGVIDAIVVQKALNMGYLGVTIAYQESLSSEIQEDVDSGSVLITKDTIYTEENQKLLFPFHKND